MPHPDHLEAVLSRRQIDDWLVFHAIEPWGGPAEDYRAALLAWSAMQPHSRRKIPLERLLIQWGGDAPPTPAEYRAKRRAFSAARG